MKNTSSKKSLGRQDLDPPASADPPPDAATRQVHIATAAYYKALARGFVPGCDLEDWLAAEAEYDAV